MCRLTRFSNAPSARQHGVRVSDALAQWVKSRIVCGPFDTAPNNAIINGIMTKGNIMDIFKKVSHWKYLTTYVFQ